MGTGPGPTTPADEDSGEIFAFTVRHLPEVVAVDGDADGRWEARAVRELVEAQAGFVHGICQALPSSGWCLQLRVSRAPGPEGRLGAHLLARIDARGGARLQARRGALCQDVRALLPYPWEPEPLAPDALGPLLEPGPAESWDVLEVRPQAQDVAPSVSLALPFRDHERYLEQTARVLADMHGPAFFAMTLRPAAVAEADLSQVVLGIGRLRHSQRRLQQIGGEEEDAAARQGHLALWTVREGWAAAAERHLMALSNSGPRILRLSVHVADANGEAGAMAKVLGAELTRRGDDAWAAGVLPAYEVVALPPAAARRIARLDGREAPMPPGGVDRSWVTPADAGRVFRLPVAVRRRGFASGADVRSEPFLAPSRTPRDEPAIVLGAILDQGRDVRRDFRLPIRSLAQHSLIFGTTGSGKSRTLRHLLVEGWARFGIPFLLIDPKPSPLSPFRQLLHEPTLRDNIAIFTVGREQPSPYRLNPFELVGQSTVEDHKKRLAHQLLEALPRYSTLRSMILQTVERVYREAGWHDEMDRNSAPEKVYPTMRDLLDVLTQGIDALAGVKPEDRSQWREVVRTHFGPLLVGSVGRMLNTARSVPFRELMRRPAILELYLPDYERALLLLFLLDGIHAYATARLPVPDRPVEHITAIDEFNRVVQPFQHVDRQYEANPAQEVVRLLEDAAATLRQFGEGLVIAGQTPDVLSSAIISNMNTKIMHRIAAGAESRAFGEAMGLDTTQMDRVQGLDAGHAIAYVQADGGPYLAHLRVPARSYGGEGPVADERVARHMAAHPLTDQAAAAPTTEAAVPGRATAACQGCPTLRGRSGCMAPALELEEDRYYGLVAQRVLSAELSRRPAAVGAAFLRLANGLAGLSAGPGVDGAAAATCFLWRLVHRNARPAGPRPAPTDEQVAEWIRAVERVTGDAAARPPDGD